MSQLSADDEIVTEERLKQALMRCFKCEEYVAEKYAKALIDSSVPEGQDLIDWCLQLAYDLGIGDLGVDGLAAYIPPKVSYSPAEHVVSDLVRGYCPDEVNDKRIVGWKINPGHSSINCIYMKTSWPSWNNRRLLFRGVPGVMMAETHLMGLFTPSFQSPSNDGPEEPNLNEFGAGVYLTYDLEYAVKCTAKAHGSAVLIFDWSGADNWSHLVFNDTDEWKKFVKKHVCANNPEKRMLYGSRPLYLDESYVYIEGKITSNYKAIKKCHDPVPSEYMQVAVLQNTSRILNERLVGILYFSTG
ncbi:hypothetical protein MP638_000194 [Amoeboaphelidium occidentale]|nr:hypothetical protein MP638_000194 [Amoeboaphelidium occidentale]